MINDSSTSPDLTERGFKWFWRTTPHDNYFNRDLFELLKGLTEGKVKGVKAIPKKDLQNLAYACENTEWGSSVAKSIEGYAKEYGFTITKGLLYTQAPDLTSRRRACVPSRSNAFAATSDSLPHDQDIERDEGRRSFLGTGCRLRVADCAKPRRKYNGVLTRRSLSTKSQG